MSETDDTDVLLLIPPGFFLVQSSGSEDSLLESSRTVVHKPTTCTARVIGKLVDQVHSLESRLESLELSTTSDTVSTSEIRARRKNFETTSFDSRSLDRKSFTFPRRRRRRTKRSITHDLSLTSFDSASSYSKNIPPLKLEINSCAKSTEVVNESLSMDGDISSIMSTPTKKNDKLLLHEIDEFLTKVETYESPESKYRTQEGASPENVIKATGEFFTQKFDKDDNIVLPSGRSVPGNVLDKYIYLVKNAGASQPDKNTQRVPCSNETNITHHSDITSKASQEISKNLHDIKSPITRRLNFSENKDVNTTSTPKKPVQTNSSHIASFRPTSNKIYDRATKVLEQYKAQSYNNNCKSSVTDTTLSSPKKEEFKMPQMRPYVPDSKDVIKLTEFQNKFMDSIDTDLLSLSDLWGERRDKEERMDSGKLEEEKLKREHCEAIIQQLQKKLLEQQEKLAVAVRVDRAKDTAIAKLREAWLKLTGSLDRAEERHRNALDKMVREVDNFKKVADDAQKKTNHFEVELYKALDLAHDYQEKCKQLTQEKKELQENAERKNLAREEVLSNKNKEIDMLKENCETIMRLNKQSTDYVKNLEEALEKEKLDHDQTKTKMGELNSRTESLREEASLARQERDVLRLKVDEERGRCGVLEQQLAERQNQTSDLLRKCDALDGEAKSLREQLQLQRGELRAHYQRQLEAAVLGKLQQFQGQLDAAERGAAEAARAREAEAFDACNRQLARIQEQHKLEINVLEEKQREEIKLYRLQLAQASEKISLLEGKLESFRQRRSQLAAQLHGVMQAQWRQALGILTGGVAAGVGGQPSLDRASSSLVQEYGPPGPRVAPDPRGLRRGARPGERGVAAVGDGAGAGDALLDALSDAEMKQYVQLLLTQPPSLDSSGECAPAVADWEPRKVTEESREEPTSDRPERTTKTAKRALNVNKPPWKS